MMLDMRQAYAISRCNPRAIGIFTRASPTMSASPPMRPDRIARSSTSPQSTGAAKMVVSKKRRQSTRESTSSASFLLTGSERRRGGFLCFRSLFCGLDGRGSQERSNYGGIRSSSSNAADKLD